MIPLLFKKTKSNDPEVMRGYDLSYSYGLRFCGLYPDFTGNIYYFYGIFINFIHAAYGSFVVAYVISIYYAFVYNDVELVSYELCYGLITFIFCMVAHYVLYRRKPLDDLFRSVGNGFFVYDMPYGEAEQAAIDECDKSCKKTARRNMVQSVFLALLICVLPSFLKGLKGSYSSIVEGGVPVNKQLALPVWCPFPTDTAPTYWTMWVIEAVSGSTEAFIVGANCTLFCNLCEIETKELRILCLALRNIRNRAIYSFKLKGYTLQPNEVYANSKLFHRCMEDCIDECIKHHIALKKFHEMFQDFAGFPIFAIFSGTALTISAPMFMLLTMAGADDTYIMVMKIVQYSYMICCFTFFLAAYCQFGQMITDESSAVHYAFYETPWIEADAAFKQKVIIGMVHSAPFVLTAKGLATASSATLLEILKTIFSYFNLFAATM